MAKPVKTRCIVEGYGLSRVTGTLKVRIRTDYRDGTYDFSEEFDTRNEALRHITMLARESSEGRG